MNPKVVFSMAGSGGWRRWFPDERAYELYHRMYPDGLKLSALDEAEHAQVLAWQEPEFVEVANDTASPMIPIMTEADRDLFSSWFTEATHRASQVISDRKDEYRSLAASLSEKGSTSEDYIFTVLVCGHTLDVGTLHELQGGIMGRPPKRGSSGSYFFWGESKPQESRYYFGVNTMGVDHFSLRYMWSPSIRRLAPNRKTLTIPVFHAEAMREVSALCSSTSKILAGAFTSGCSKLNKIIEESSFASCSMGDVLCMIFHIGYGGITETLVKENVLPDFPQEPDDAWGVWAHWQ